MSEALSRDIKISVKPKCLTRFELSIALFTVQSDVIGIVDAQMFRAELATCWD